MTNGYRRPSSVALAAAIALLVSGCAARPGQTTRVALGDVLAVSSPCQCRFRYPAAWFLRTAIGDTSQPQLALHSYNDATLDHLPVPTRSAAIGLDWRPDPDGLLYRAISAPGSVGMC